MDNFIAIVKEFVVLLFEELLGRPIKLIDCLTQTQRLELLELLAYTRHIVESDDDLVELLNLPLGCILAALVCELSAKTAE